tara:strand:+ start:59 stop:277 length:219 start_codon:yes stop_codon:yes gene_type:complete
MSTTYPDLDVTDDRERAPMDEKIAEIVEYEINNLRLNEIIAMASQFLTDLLEEKTENEVQEIYNQLFNRSVH